MVNGTALRLQEENRELRNLTTEMLRALRTIHQYEMTRDPNHRGALLVIERAVAKAEAFGIAP